MILLLLQELPRELLINAPDPTPKYNKTKHGLRKNADKYIPHKST